MPLRSGREMSSSSTLQRDLRNSLMASSPVSASPASTMSRCSARICFRPSRTMAWSSAIKTRMLVFSLMLGGLDLDGHHRATSGRGRQAERAFHRARAFAHAAQAERLGLEAVFRRDAAAIIADAERQVLALAAQRD